MTGTTLKPFDPVQDIVDFHTKFEQQYNGPARPLPDELQHFRLKFLEEELEEYVDYVRMLRLSKPDVPAKGLEGAFDGLIDLVYVALGTAYLHGFDFREGWRRVHEANMKKVLANPEGDDRSHRDAKFDIVKPEGWTPPSLNDLVDPAHYLGSTGEE